MTNSIINYIANQFNLGGPFMWVILAVLAVACAVTLERLIFYFIICSNRGANLVAQAVKALNNDKIDDARKVLSKKKSPLNVLLLNALDSFTRGVSIDEIQEGIEECAIKEIPRYAQRINYLALFANIATLLGLLGTITGLQVSFESLGAAEAAKKATLLANGISQAMITTAFGLIVAIPCMILYTMLSNKQQELTRDLDEAVVRMMNYLRKKSAV